jgi:hypothetical protein
MSKLNLFVQPRFKELFRNIATYWEKDDHDYRVNDSDPYVDFPVTHELGVKNFKEQLPVTDPKDPEAVTYRTYQLSKDLQIWLLENRDYRSPNKMPDGQDKTIWGKEQKEWLKRKQICTEPLPTLLTDCIGRHAYIACVVKKMNHHPHHYENSHKEMFSLVYQQLHQIS